MAKEVNMRKLDRTPASAQSNSKRSTLRAPGAPLFGARSVNALMKSDLCLLSGQLKDFQWQKGWRDLFFPDQGEKPVSKMAEIAKYSVPPNQIIPISFGPAKPK